MSNYNLSNLTGTSNYVDYAIATNALTGGAFFGIVTLFVLVISFVSMKNFDTRTALLSSSFVTLVLASLLWSLSLLSEVWFMGYVSLFLVALFVKFT